jgi:predicted MPP superfamily phosphohydrolase
MKRRTFLKVLGGSLTAAAAGTAFYAWRVEPHWVEMVHVPLPIRGLPASLRGRTLVQLSDIHVGTCVDDNYLVASFQRVASLKPDIVVITGDLVSYHDAVLPQFRRVFTDAPRGSLATLATLGNHDYGPCWTQPETADTLTQIAGQLGVTVLRNETRDVAGLQIAGLDDYWAGRCRIREGVKLLDPARPSLVLSHNPDTADLTGWGDYQGWILSGHTHGGQCKPPFLAPPRLPVANRRYTAGQFDLADGRTLYINRGLGYLRRVRFNARPEVTVFELTDS